MCVFFFLVCHSGGILNFASEYRWDDRWLQSIDGVTGDVNARRGAYASTHHGYFYFQVRSSYHVLIVFNGINRELFAPEQSSILRTQREEFRHGNHIRPQISAASLTNRPQPKAIITIIILKLKLWPTAGCEATIAAEISSRPLLGMGTSTWYGIRAPIPQKVVKSQWTVQWFNQANQKSSPSPSLINTDVCNSLIYTDTARCTI